MLYQIILLDGMKIYVDGEPFEIPNPMFAGFKFFIYQGKEDGIEKWVVSEVITGAQIAVGLTKPEAIGAAVTKLFANGRDVLIEKIEEFTHKYGRTEAGITMNIPSHA